MVIHVVFMLGLETWVMTPIIGRTLGLFRHRVDPCLAGMQPKWDMAGQWEYPPLDAAMLEVVIEEVYTYVLFRQKNITRYIVTRQILELYLSVEQQPGAKVLLRWWEQDRIDLLYVAQ